MAVSPSTCSGSAMPSLVVRHVQRLSPDIQTVLNLDILRKATVRQLRDLQGVVLVHVLYQTLAQANKETPHITDLGWCNEAY